MWYFKHLLRPNQVFSTPALIQASSFGARLHVSQMIKKYTTGEAYRCAWDKPFNRRNFKRLSSQSSSNWRPTWPWPDLTNSAGKYWVFLVMIPVPMKMSYSVSGSALEDVKEGILIISMFKTFKNIAVNVRQVSRCIIDHVNSFYLENLTLSSFEFFFYTKSNSRW